MAESTNQNQGSSTLPKGERKPKQGNTELFNELLSRANALSVKERTRLVKSLAGQLNLVVVGSSDLLQKGKAQQEKKKVEQKAQPEVRPNPLKGTQFEVEKDRAYKALVDAKVRAQGAKLPENAPEVIAYATALAAYKAEHKRLAPVIQQVPVPQQKNKARTTSNRSPEPPGTNSSNKRGIFGVFRKGSASNTTTTTATPMETDGQ